MTDSLHTEPVEVTQADSEAAARALASWEGADWNAEEPVDPLLVEARTIAGNATTERGWAQWAEKGECDQTHVVRSTLAALRRGMELRPPLTVEVVRGAVNKVWSDADEQMTVTGFADRLHAALTKRADR